MTTAMTPFARTMLLAAALLALPAGALSSAVPQAGTATDETYRPGQDGVDLAAVTGPKGSGEGKLPACADPARRGDLRPC